MTTASTNNVVAFPITKARPPQVLPELEIFVDDFSDYVTGELPDGFCFTEILDAFRNQGVEVQRFIIHENNVAVPVAND